MNLHWNRRRTALIATTAMVGATTLALRSFSADARPVPAYTIVSGCTGEVLDVRYSSANAGAPVITWMDTQNANQHWQVLRRSGSVAVVAVHSQQVLTARHNRFATQVRYSAAAAAATAQRWRIRKRSNGMITLSPVSSPDRYLTLPSLHRGLGSQLAVLPKRRGCRQLWRLEPAQIPVPTVPQSGQIAYAAALPLLPVGAATQAAARSALPIQLSSTLPPRPVLAPQSGLPPQSGLAAPSGVATSPAPAVLAQSLPMHPTTTTAAAATSSSRTPSPPNPAPTEPAASAEPAPTTRSTPTAASGAATPTTAVVATSTARATTPAPTAATSGPTTALAPSTSRTNAPTTAAPTAPTTPVPTTSVPTAPVPTVAAPTVPTVAGPPTNPTPMGPMGHADVVLPAPAVGLAVGGTYVEREPIQRPSADGTGNFRVACKFSHMNFDDPIVHPGQPGTAHLHTYFGNVAANASSTGTSLLAAGNSTCDGGILNRSSYWIPTMMNAAGQPVAPAENTVYYKSGYQGVTPAQIAAEFPVGLQLIAGNAAATSPDPNRQVNWMCNADQNRMGTIPDCPAGGTLRAEVQFPQCWNGRDLSSPDHVSHLAYGQLGSGCPASHPVALSAITFGVDWIVPAGGTSGWHLSSDASPSARGASLHGDVITAWDPATARTWLANCVRVNADCHIGWLTDNDRLIRGTR